MKNFLWALAIIGGMVILIWATTRKKQVERATAPPPPIGPAAYPKTEAETVAENTFNILQAPGTFFTPIRIGV